MSQRNIQIDDILWDQFFALSKAMYKSRAVLVRDAIYTMLAQAAAAQPLTLQSAPYRSKVAVVLGPNQALVQTSKGTELTTVDARGLIVKGAPAGAYLVSYPGNVPPRVMPDYVAAALAHKPGDPRAAKVSGYVENLKTAPKPDESE